MAMRLSKLAGPPCFYYWNKKNMALGHTGHNMFRGIRLAFSQAAVGGTHKTYPVDLINLFSYLAARKIS
jgi:hypothetical protein